MTTGIENYGLDSGIDNYGWNNGKIIHLKKINTYILFLIQKTGIKMDVTQRKII